MHGREMPRIHCAVEKARDKATEAVPKGPGCLCVSTRLEVCRNVFAWKRSLEVNTHKTVN